MKKRKRYRGIIFSADVIQEALKVALEPLESPKHQHSFRRISRGDEIWNFDSDEEFFSEYRQGFTSTDWDYAAYSETSRKSFDFNFSADSASAIVTVEAKERREIERIFDVFERHLDESRIPVPAAPEPPPPTVFIGHGRSQQWRDLKDHLREQHGYTVEAYEVGARAGHAVRDILAEMLESSSFAVLIMTAEDETAEETFGRDRMLCMKPDYFRVS